MAEAPMPVEPSRSDLAQFLRKRRLALLARWRRAVDDGSIDRAIAASLDRYVRSRDRTLKALDRISAAALETRRLDDFLERLLAVLVEATPSVDVGAVLLRERDHLRIRATAGLGRESLAEGKVRIGEGFLGRVGAEGRGRSLSGAEVGREDLAPVRRAGLRAVYGVPLQGEGSLVGVAFFGSLTARRFSEADRRLFNVMVARATSGIVQHQLHHDAQARAAELAAVIESIPDAVLVGDRSGVRHANRAALAILGSPSREDVHRRLYQADALEVRRAQTGDVLRPEDRPFLRALAGETLTDDLALVNATTGQPMVLRVSAAPVVLEGQVAGAVVVGRDITGEERAAGERQRLLTQARQAVADRDHVLAVVSHDLRQPLNTIALSAAVLKDTVGPGGPEAVPRSIAGISRATRRMDRMIRDLLDVSSIQAGRLSIHLRPVDARALVEETVEAFQDEALRRGLGLAGQAPEGVALVRADRDRILQALANLVGNALKVTPAGHVTVGARVLDAATVVFEVRDTGPGIAPNLRERVFEPYWRGRTGYQGTGLGLAIARGIVEAHGGRIWVESEVGAGSAFRFTVPLSGASPPGARW